MQLTPQQQKVLIKVTSSSKLFSQNIIGGQHWKGMNDLFDAIDENDNVAVKGGHGISKSYSVARAAIRFLSCYPPSKVICTGPTYRQVHDIFWSEVSKIYGKIKHLIGGRITNNKLELRPDWFMTAFVTKDYQENAFQGYHSPNIMIIFEEACGVPKIIWDAAEGIKTGKVVKHIAIGQPHDPTSEFAKCFTDKAWKKITMSAYDSPNVTGECYIPGLADTKWINGRKDKWGEESAIFGVRVLGEFPKSSVDTLLSISDVEFMINNVREAEGMLIGSLDVARFGDDSSVFTIMDLTGCVKEQIEVYKQDTMFIAGMAREIIKQHRLEALGIDVIGIGSGVYDRLGEQGENVIPIDVAESPRDTEKFLNLRAEIYWHVRENKKTIHILDNQAAADLSNIKFKYRSDGKIQLEPKEEMKKRLGHSPDHGDGIAMAYYVKELFKSARAQTMTEGGENTAVKSHSNIDFKKDWVD